MTKQRRAISEVIVSLMLLAITVVGGLLVFAIVTGNEDIASIGGSIDEAGNRGTAVKAVGFDTRDGLNLSSIDDLDNNVNGELTTGTDFIVIKIRNTSVGLLTIHGLFVNEIDHTWDTESAGDATSVDLPDAGEFSIISDSNSNLVQFSTPQVLVGQDVRLIIKLKSTVNGANEVKLTEGIRIDIQASDFDPVRFIIPAGSAR